MMRLTTRAVKLATRSWTAYRFINVDVPLALPWGGEILIPVYDRKGHWNLSVGPRDLEFVTLLRKVLATTDGAVIDVGANVGRFLIYLVSLDPHRSYLGAEPSVSCCAYLNRLIAANHLPKHRVLACALADYNGVVAFATDSDEDVFGTTTVGHYPAGFLSRTSLVACLKGDTALAARRDVGRVALLKVDVEGGEIEVLKGFQEVIERDRPVLLMEVAPPMLGHVDESVTSLRTRRSMELTIMVDSMGYASFRIVKGGLLEPQPVGRPLGSRSSLEYMDYLCLPRTGMGDWPRIFDIEP